MYLAKVEIQGFRGIQNATVDLQPGLNTLVGENNAGKTAIIDAIRLALSLTLDQDRPKVTKDDFFTAAGARVASISVALTFRGLSPTDEGRFLEALVGDATAPEARLGVLVTRELVPERIRVRHWCGDNVDNPMPVQVAEWVGTAFLQPLRDPTTGLEPGRTSQIGRLLATIASAEEQDELVNTVSAANEALRGLKPVIRTQAAMNKTFDGVAGEEMSQKAALSFAEPEFEQLRRSLQTSVDGFAVRQNGLGFNNLLFTATVFAALQADKTYAVRILLVEEPEAHLHPQLQHLLIRFLERQCNVAGSPTQVVFSTHSAHVASIVPIHSHVLVSRTLGITTASNALFAGLSDGETRKLARYLDATRSVILFARKVILVEGISEVLLLNRLSVLLGMDLRDRGISVISTEGLNFGVFMKLLGPKGLGIPTAIVTDSDGFSLSERVYPGPGEQPTRSPTADVILDGATYPLRAFLAQATLEYDLALHSNANLALAVDAFAALHPIVASAVRSELVAISGQREQAAHFHQRCFDTRKTRKPDFIQEVVDRLQENSEWVPPPYLVDALRYVWG